MQSALILQFARTPDELTALNAVNETIYGGVALLGPAVAGLMIAISGVGLVFAVFAILLLAAALICLGLTRAPTRRTQGYISCVRRSPGSDRCSRIPISVWWWASTTASRSSRGRWTSCSS